MPEVLVERSFWGDILFPEVVNPFGYIQPVYAFRRQQRVARGGQHHTVTPMLIMALANALNLVLDPLFIFGIGPWTAGGVAGAGVATVLSQATATTVIIGLLTRLYGVFQESASEMEHGGKVE